MDQGSTKHVFRGTHGMDQGSTKHVFRVWIKGVLNMFSEYGSREYITCFQGDTWYGSMSQLID